MITPEPTIQVIRYADIKMSARDAAFFADDSEQIKTLRNALQNLLNACESSPQIHAESVTGWPFLQAQAHEALANSL